mmetsp:Transcript_4197/g.10250  ORF Transcript_4197/g.10250 Transcript_4197/m.10250 type:complete len:201 (+) Transcript_4197:643-1245(+)
MPREQQRLPDGAARVVHGASGRQLRVRGNRRRAAVRRGVHGAPVGRPAARRQPKLALHLRRALLGGSVCVRIGVLLRWQRPNQRALLLRHSTDLLQHQRGAPDQLVPVRQPLLRDWRPHSRGQPSSPHWDNDTPSVVVMPPVYRMPAAQHHVLNISAALLVFAHPCAPGSRSMRVHRGVGSPFSRDAKAQPRGPRGWLVA